jgi:hypothetical protein
MPDGFEIDFSDLTKLTANIEEAPREARGNLRKGVTVTAHNIKDAWAGKVEGSPGLEGLASAVTYDVLSDNSPVAPITAEIGFDKGRRQGPLGNISEFGTAHHPPRGYGLAALQENIEDFEKGIGLAIDQTHKSVGL